LEKIVETFGVRTRRCERVAIATAAGLDAARETGDNAARDGVLKLAKGVANSDDVVTDLDIARVTNGRWDQFVALGVL